MRAATQIEYAVQALRKAKVKNPTIIVVVHSQGTEIAFRAFRDFLSKDTLAMIEFYGVGGETFVPNDIGLKSAKNYMRENDPVPIWANRSFRKVLYSRQHTYDVTAVGRGGLGGPFGFGAHNWKNNYEMLFDQPGGVQLPNDAKKVDYPKFILPR